MSQLLSVSPGIRSGASNGIRITVLTTASGMIAAAREMSARAFLMRIGNIGAVGRQTEDEQPHGVGLRHRQDLRQQDRQGRSDQPTPPERQPQQPGRSART